MEILEFGNKSNKKIILIHGFESPYQIWKKYIEHYEKDFHIIVPILPGHNPDFKEEFVDFNQCAKEIEDLCLSRYSNQVYAVYAMSMGGVLACHLWKNGIIKIENLILESSPIISFNKLITSVMTKVYLSITHKAQQRDEKTVKQAVDTMVKEEQLDDFLKLLDNISDNTIINYLSGIGKFKLPDDINTPDTRFVYYYGGKVSEMVFRNVAKRLKKIYPQAETICLKGKGHCEDALLNPEIRINELDGIIH